MARGINRDGAWTRRELLASFLAAPVVASACGRFGASAPSLPPGDLVGPSVEIGHRLRDGFRPEPAADAWIETGVVVAGGGCAGLAAAWRLLRAGVSEFQLLELESSPGGTARSGHSEVVGYPWGAHYIPAPLKDDRTLIALLDELGVIEGTDAQGNPLVGEQYLCRDPEERVYHQGRWYEGLYLRAGASAEDERQFDSFRQATRRWSAWRDARGRRAFAIPVATSSQDAEVTALDKISMASWMDAQGYSSPRLRWYVEYACRDDYGTHLEETSAWAGLFYFCARLGDGSDEAQPLVTWPEGNGHLVNHLYGAARAQTRLGMAVTDVRASSAGNRAMEVVAFDVNAGAPVGFRCDQVIFAAPRFLASRLIAGYRENPPAYLADFEYGSWAVANLHLRDRPATRPFNFPLCWDNVLYDSPSLGYVVATHQTELDRGPTVFSYYYPLCDADAAAARTRMLAAGRDEWAEVALSDLEFAHPDIRSLTERIDVMRWGHAMIRPKPGFLWSSSRQLASQPYGNIHFAHTDLSGVALFEEALYHGVRAAEEVLAARNIRTGSLVA